MLKKRMMYLWSVAAFMVVMGFHVITFAGDLEPPLFSVPAPTMRTLGELHPTWNKTIPFSSKRFEVALTGAAAFLDKETGLVWEKSPDITGGPSSNGKREWTNAIAHCYKRKVGGRKGWRLPKVEELASLVGSLPSPHPFENVQSSRYWSATTDAGDTTRAWFMERDMFGNSSVDTYPKETVLAAFNYVWCVRGGQ